MAAAALAGRVILVTGSSRGIGAEVAVKAAAEGASVAVHYHRSREGADETIRRIRDAAGTAEAFQADVGDGEAAERLVAAVIGRFEHIDGLVNNAGRTLVGPFLETSPETWDEVIRTDLSAAFHTCRAALPSMLERGSGSIVNIASRLAQMGIAETAAYSAAKAGLVGLTRALAREFGPRGIRVNAVCPGGVHTPLAVAVNGDALDSVMKVLAPLGRIGQPEDIAAMVHFLASDDAAYVTGQAYLVDGGWSLGTTMATIDLALAAG